ncbi:MAG: phosphoglycerate dehydrogenase [Planctomycetaceae bacterium]|nr:phosphoglycerate dehydrogenase [Planctomycetaceae bacterium]
MKAVVMLGESFYAACPDLGEELRRLHLEVVELVNHDSPTPLDEILPAVADADIIVVGVERITSQVIDHAPNLKIILKHGAGYDNIDVAYAGKKGIRVAYAGHANAGSVAELTMGLMLAAARGIVTSNIRLVDNRWMLYMGDMLEGATLGVIGFGAIGKRVGRYAQAFGMEVLASDPFVTPENAASAGAALMPMETLLRRSDFVTVHVPATRDNLGLIDGAALAMMKRTAILINTSRGEVVDEDALIEALKTGVIKGAALDVFSSEPPRPEIVSLPNVVATPHIGGSSLGGAQALCRASVENVKRFLNGEELHNRL